MKLRAPFCFVLLLAILPFSLSGQEPPSQPESEPEAPQAPSEDEKEYTFEEILELPMSNLVLHALILSLDPEPKGLPGMWEFNYEGSKLICMTDEAANRMRILTPIRELAEVSDEELRECMEANFDRALDARYCINHGILWGAFIHPLSTLSATEFYSAVQQVVGVKENFGSSYSSGGMIFRGGEERQEEEQILQTPPS